MELLDDVGLVDYRFVPFRGAASVDVCTVCAKHTIGLEIILDTPDETFR